MHLYTYDPAPNPKRVTYLMQYKGIELPTTQINLRELQQFSDEFKAINANCTVPTLQLDDGEVICSTIAVAQYLDSVYPDKPLFGETALEKARISDWVHRIYTEGFMAIADMLRNGNPAFKDRPVPGQVKLPQLPELVERGKLRLDAFWVTMDQHLEGRDFVAGPTPSMADIDLMVCAEFSSWVKESVPESASNIHAWLARFKEVMAGTVPFSFACDTLSLVKPWGVGGIIC